MADDKAVEAGQQPAQKIGRKPVGGGANTATTSDPAPPPPPAATGTENNPDEPPPAYEPPANGQTFEDTKEPITEPAGEPSRSEAEPSSSQRQRTPPGAIQIDNSKPEDFDGEIATNNEIPSPELIKKLDEYIVLDKHGKSHTFKSLYTGNNVARRVLIIFVRHFFCGNCQEYLRTLTDLITPDSLLKLPVSTFILIIGCGEPSLIDFYAETTGCSFPIYTDPQRSLFLELGMTQTWEMGTKPSYIRKSMGASVFSSIAQGLKAIPTGKALKSGHFSQVGGEFLFEPPHMVTPVTTPREERQPSVFGGKSKSNADDDEEDEQRLEPKRVTWCHRMKTTRDHVEIPELMEILGLDQKPEIDEKEQEKWDQASRRSRKGTGTSMARQMSELSKSAEEESK